MKLASLKGGRDGRLVVVSNDLTRSADASAVAPTLQAALDDWATAEPQLREIAATLESGGGNAFRAEDCAAPLPRAYQWADGSVYLNHMQLVRKARGAEMPDSFLSDPLIYQGGSDSMTGARDDILMADEAWGIDFEAEVVVIVDDVPMGVSAADAAGHIKLVSICNDVSLRALIPNELGKGFGFFQSKPATAFAPVVVTPDALGDAWDGSKTTPDMLITHNGKRVGNPNTGADMNFEFPAIIEHAARTRFLGAGAIVGSGTISNVDRARGSETIEHGEPKTPFMKFGDSVTIDMLNADGNSIFGSIEQKVVKYAPPG